MPLELSSSFKTYFFLIWLVLMLYIVLNFYFRGRKALLEFGKIDYSSARFYEKFASGYSTKSYRTKRGGASKVLHILITDTELITKSFLFVAEIARRNDLFNRIPLGSIRSVEIKKGSFFTKLFVKFENVKGEQREIVIMSSSFMRIKALLDEAIEMNLKNRHSDD